MFTKKQKLFIQTFVLIVALLGGFMSVTPVRAGTGAAPRVTVSTPSYPVGINSGESKSVPYSLTESGNVSGVITSRTYRFYTQYDVPLSNFLGPYFTNIKVDALQTNRWEEPVYLPQSVVEQARALGKYTIVLKTTFTGKSASGVKFDTQASLLLLLPPAGFSKDTPVNGATGQPVNQSLQWNGSVGAIDYEYCFDTVDNNSCDTDWTGTYWLGTYDTNALLQNLPPATTFYWQVRANNMAGTTYANNGRWWSFTTIAASPTVSSVVRAGANPTSLASVDFIVTFSKPVTGVDTTVPNNEDFVLFTTGVTDAAITEVSGTGATRTVTVNTGSGSGTIRLDVPVTANITDLDGNLLADLPFLIGEVYRVEKLPDRTTLVWPGGDINTNTPAYKWNKVNDATWYYLWVNGPSGNVIRQWYEASAICIESTCSVTPTTVLSTGAHKWWVQTWNSAGYGPWSAEMNFTVPAPTLPGKAILTKPIGNTFTKTPTYTWAEASDTTWYYLYVNGPSGNVIRQWYDSAAICSSGTCSVTPTTTLGSGAHKWWIQTWGPTGYGPWSDTMDFTVAVPGKAILSDPTGSITDTTPDYTWGAVEGATWYYLYVNGPSGNVIRQWYDASVICSGGTCAVTPTTTLGSGAHKWWVQTWSPVGYGLWSDPMDFTLP